MVIILEKLYIGVSGVSEQPSHRIIEYVDEFLKKIKDVGVKVTFILGGYWGFMKYFADRAVENNHEVVFIIPSEPIETPPNKLNTVIIQTDLGSQSRSIMLAKTCDILIVFGGRVGSMTEALSAYSFNKPVVIIESGYETDKLGSSFPEYFDIRKNAPVYFVKTIDEVISIIKKYVEKRVRRINVI